jgi:hypothetical protein
VAGYERYARLARIRYADPRGLLCLALAPSGMAAAGGRDGSVTVWNADSDAPLARRLAGGASPVTSVAFSPADGALAAANEDGLVRRWDPTGGQRMGRTLHAPGGAIWAIAFSPDGRWLASAGEDGRYGCGRCEVARRAADRSKGTRGPRSPWPLAPMAGGSLRPGAMEQLGYGTRVAASLSPSRCAGTTGPSSASPSAPSGVGSRQVARTG